MSDNCKSYTYYIYKHCVKDYLIIDKYKNTMVENYDKLLEKIKKYKDSSENDSLYFDTIMLFFALKKIIKEKYIIKRTTTVSFAISICFLADIDFLSLLTKEEILFFYSLLVNLNGEYKRSIFNYELNQIYKYDKKIYYHIPLKYKNYMLKYIKNFETKDEIKYYIYFMYTKEHFTNFVKHVPNFMHYKKIIKYLSQKHFITPIIIKYYLKYNLFSYFKEFNKPEYNDYYDYYDITINTEIKIFNIIIHYFKKQDFRFLIKYIDVEFLILLLEKYTYYMYNSQWFHFVYGNNNYEFKKYYNNILNILSIFDKKPILKDQIINHYKLIIRIFL